MTALDRDYCRKWGEPASYPDPPPPPREPRIVPGLHTLEAYQELHALERQMQQQAQLMSPQRGITPFGLGGMQGSAPQYHPLFGWR